MDVNRLLLLEFPFIVHFKVSCKNIPLDTILYLITMISVSWSVFNSITVTPSKNRHPSMTTIVPPKLGDIPAHQPNKKSSPLHRLFCFPSCRSMGSHRATGGVDLPEVDSLMRCDVCGEPLALVRTCHAGRSPAGARTGESLGNRNYGKSPFLMGKSWKINYQWPFSIANC